MTARNHRAVLLASATSTLLAVAPCAHAQTGWVCTRGASSLQKYRIEGNRLLTTDDAYSTKVGPMAWQIVVNNETGIVAIQAASAKGHNGTYASIILIDKESGRIRYFGAPADADPGYDDAGTCVPY